MEHSEPLGLHTVPFFYGVYILKSDPKPKSIYIGSTPDPQRRLRQHNGDNVGGAYKTKRNGFRPWKMVVLIHGFPLKIAALQYEHALQHSEITRHIKPEDKLQKSLSIHNKLANVRLLNNSKLFSMMNLKVSIFDEEVYKLWSKNRYKIPETTFANSSLEVFDEFLKSINGDDSLDEDLKKDILFKVYNCDLCAKKIDYITDSDNIIKSKFELDIVLKKLPLFTICTCHNTYHLTCLARTSSDFIPETIICDCGNKLIWKQVVKTSLLVRKYLLKDLIVKDLKA